MNKEIYKTAFKNLKVHYFLNVVIVFIVGLILKDGYQYTTDLTAFTPETTPDSAIELIREDKKTNFEIILDILGGKGLFGIDTENLAETTAQKYTMGYFSVIVNEITSSGSFGLGLMNGLNKIIFDGEISESVIIFIMMILTAFFWVFFKNIILVGRCRYFLEKRLYPDTNPDRLLFVYRTENLSNVTKVMLLRSIKQFLWSLTVIGGVIKYYEYLAVPYILAENPQMTAKEAFSLSKNIMKGDKRYGFLIDLSLLPGVLLDGLTLHLTSLFFLNPYKECLYSEFYAQLRIRKKPGLEYSALLHDSLLFETDGSLSYPDDKCPYPYEEKHKWLKTDFDRPYGGNTCILFFFFFSMFGWLFEVFFYLVNEGSFINRGTMTGPWLPIYGFGGLVIIYLMPYEKKSAPFVRSLVCDLRIARILYIMDP